MRQRMTRPIQSIALPDGFLDRIVADVADFNRRVHRKPLPAIRANFERTQYGAFDMVAPFALKFTRPAILEIGSGYGFGLCYLLKSGLDAYGIEPGNTESFVGRHVFASQLLRHNSIDPTDRIIAASGEALPFPDNHFDIVFSIAVLEHVKDLDRVMAEALRVCKPSGCVVMNVPNYNSFYEGHYNIPWIPYVMRRKTCAARYVRDIWRRDSYYIDELHFTVPGDFRRNKPWFALAQEVTIFPFLFRPLLYVSALAYFLGINSYDRHPLLKCFSPKGGLRLLCGPVLLLTRLFTIAAAQVGLAPVFNVVAYKYATAAGRTGSAAAIDQKIQQAESALSPGRLSLK
jgi:SAM-dependent methyltransferase